MSNENQISLAEKSQIRAGFFELESFELLQRVAKAFSASSLVPQHFQGNLSNCMIALNLAERLKADALMVMQNLYIVNGKPGWSAKFLIATFNHCGRFSAIKYQFFGEEGKDSWGCRAYSTELSSGEKIVGPEITLKLAKDEGWAGKNGSKWKTMPQLMLMYRSAAWMINTAAPEISMGLPTTDELHDIIDVSQDGSTAFYGVESSTPRAPIADVVQPKSKSARAADKMSEQSDSDGVIDISITTQEKVQKPAHQQPGEAHLMREPGSDDDIDEKVSDSVLRVLMTKIEIAELSEEMMKEKFGFGYEGVKKQNYSSIIKWVSEK